MELLRCIPRLVHHSHAVEGERDEHVVESHNSGTGTGTGTGTRTGTQIFRKRIKSDGV